jgi:hypothetical protein
VPMLPMMLVLPPVMLSPPPLPPRAKIQRVQ